MSDLPLLLDLSDSQCASPRLVGAKAASLHRALREGFPVPPGFVIAARATSSSSPRILASAARERLNQLVDRARSHKAIVRSSALQEDRGEHLFPGMLLSVLGVTDEQSLSRAIEACIRAAHEPRVRTYCSLIGLDFKSLALALVVQEEIVPTLAGVAFSQPPDPGIGHSGVLVELVPGSSSQMLAGAQPGAAYLIDDSDIRRLDTLGQTPPASKSQLREVARLATQLDRLFGRPQDVEWAFDERGLHMVQSRPLVREITRPRLKPRQQQLDPDRRVLPDEDSLGLKGAAMMFFENEGLFTRRVRFLGPYGDLQAFSRQVSDTNFGPDGVTIRFSHGHDLGLPRFFVRSGAEATDVITREWRREWLAIVHGYIRVQRSFELYVDRESAVLEHVPGVWESDSTAAPDVIIHRDSVRQALRATMERPWRVRSPEGMLKKMVQPTSRFDLETWSRRIEPLCERFRNQFAQRLPLIFHFVEDQDGQWCFLNIRVVSRLSGDYAQRGSFHVVRSTRDLETWDGSRPILLQVSTARGDERLLEGLAQQLPRENGKVFIDFGTLSHPALVLREFGIHPTPAYLSHEPVPLSGPTIGV